MTDEAPSQLPADICDCVETILSLLTKQTEAIEQLKAALTGDERTKAIDKLRQLQVYIREQGHKIRAWRTVGRRTGLFPQRELPSPSRNTDAAFLASLHAAGDRTLDREESAV